MVSERSWKWFSSITKADTAQDVLLSLAHWHLIENDFMCVGDGEVSRDEGIELPRNWNTRNNYELKYRRDDSDYTLYGTVMQNNKILINFLQGAINCVEFEVKLEVVDLSKKLLKNKVSGEVLDRFQTAFLDVIEFGKILNPPQLVSRSTNSTPYAHDALSPPIASPNLSPTMLDTFWKKIQSDPEFREMIVKGINEKTKYDKKIFKATNKLKSFRLD